MKEQIQDLPFPASNKNVAMSMSSVGFSIIIPAYNEKGRLPVFLRSLVGDVLGANLCGEIIIVDDGSTEENYKAYLDAVASLRLPSAGMPVKILRLKRNLGKGAAIKEGFKEAKGEWMGFVDADGATPSGEILRIIKIALSSDKLDGVFGARVRMLGYDVDRKLGRYLFSRFLNAITYSLFRIPFYDALCGCKFFRKDSISPFLELSKEKEYLLDVELMVIGCLHKLNFIEVPISWKDVCGSKLNFIKDGFKILRGLRRIKARFK